MPLPTSRAQLYGAALISPTYHITIKVMDPSSYDCYFTHIHAIDNATEVPPPHAHRSFGTSVNDWKYEHLEWNSTDPDRGLNVRLRMKCDGEKEMEWKDEDKAREVRNIAQQKGERVPDKREALAMACMTRTARRAIGSVLHEQDFGVLDEREFLIISSRSEGTVEASLYVDGKEKQRFVAKGSGDDHFEAVAVLGNEVSVEHKRRRREEQRRHVVECCEEAESE